MPLKNPKIIALIMAAGRGMRVGGSQPKQYQTLQGRPILEQSLQHFLEHPLVDGVRIVIGPKDQELYHQTIQRFQSPKLLSPVEGGQERQESVRKGLDSLEELTPEYVLIHDGARPFVTPQVITRVIEALEKNKGVIPGTPVVDTLKEVRNGVIKETTDRHNLYRAQTPQGFDFQTILLAHRQFQNEEGFTDDASLLERLNIPVALVMGDPKNRKVTMPEDMKGNSMSAPDIRVGHGIDVHAIGPGKGVTLLGIFIPIEFSLIGHSDADVGLHSLADALLGAIGDKDIGHHFSPKDDRWKGMDSALIVKESARRVREQGGRISHVDITIMGERPKVSGYRDQMVKRVAQILEVEERRVSVKATTTEKLGFVGREEGLAAFATATVVF